MKKQEKMSRKNFIAVVASISLTMFLACTQRNSFVVEGIYDCDDGMCEVVAYTNEESSVVAPIINGKFSLTLPLQDNKYLRNLDEISEDMEECSDKKNVKGIVANFIFRTKGGDAVEKLLSGNDFVVKYVYMNEDINIIGTPSKDFETDVYDMKLKKGWNTVVMYEKENTNGTITRSITTNAIPEDAKWNFPGCGKIVEGILETKEEYLEINVNVAGTTVKAPIENKKFSLILPIPNDEDMRILEEDLEGLTFSKKDVKWAMANFDAIFRPDFYLRSRGMRLTGNSNKGSFDVLYTYVSEDIDITGIKSSRSENSIYEVNFKKGWNTVVKYKKENADKTITYNLTTDPIPEGAKWEIVKFFIVTDDGKTIEIQ